MRHSSGLKHLLVTADAQARGAVAAGAWQTPGAAAGQALGLGLLLVPVGGTHSGAGRPRHTDARRDGDELMLAEVAPGS